MTPPEKKTVTWAVLIAVVSSLCGFGGTVAAMAIKGGEVLQRISQAEKDEGGQALRVALVETRVSQAETRLAVLESLAGDLRKSQQRIEDKILSGH